MSAATLERAPRSALYSLLLLVATCVGALALAARAASVGGAQAHDPAFEEGVEAYRSGDWAVARRAFSEALEAGLSERASVLRNLGNVAFREGRPLEAAGWFTAAVREAPRDAEAWFNLEFARRQAGLDPADRGDLRDTAVRLATLVRLDEAERLVLGVLALLACALIWEALRGGLAAKATSWALAGLLCVALAPYVVQSARARADTCIAIQPEGAALSSEPREGAALIARLAPAAHVERVDQLPGWVRVRSAAGELGWVRAESVLALSARASSAPR